MSSKRVVRGWKFLRRGGSTKTPWNGKSWGVGGGGANQRVFRGEVWIFSGTTHSPSFYKTLQVLWCRLTFTFHLIDNKKLKNTMEGECNPTGNNENSGIKKDFSIIPLQ